MYIEGDPVLHMVCEETAFQNAKFLDNLTTAHIWDTIRYMWIDTYVGPPDMLVLDAGKNLTSQEFRQHAAVFGIEIKVVPVEAHHSVGKIERYHASVRRVYLCVRADTPASVSKHYVLQTAMKAINDTVGPEGLAPSLLVFGAYPRINQLDPPSPSVSQRARTIVKAMNEARKAHAARDVQDALATRNGPSTEAVRDLPLGSYALVWREGRNRYWEGPYRIIAQDGESSTLEMENGTADFRNTSLKPYYDTEQIPDRIEPADDLLQPITASQPPQMLQPPKRRVGRPRKYPLQAAYDAAAWSTDTTPPSIFTASRQAEIHGLLERGVFEFIDHDQVPPGVRIYNSRFVDTIKNEGAENAYEKSRLVIQAYADDEKHQVLTESPTIQRASFRLLLALAASLRPHGMNLYVRDITQAYVQSETKLVREFYAKPPSDLRLPEESILKVVKPLYGIPEAGNHWYKTYRDHHVNRLKMRMSSYDSCLLLTTSESGGRGIIGLQVDDTIMLADDDFCRAEQAAMDAAGFATKSIVKLVPGTSEKFNGNEVMLHVDGTITITQERHCKALNPVTLAPQDLSTARGNTRKNATMQEQYIAQRARAAYVAISCQPEACVDLSMAAQTTSPTPEDMNALNKRIHWHKANSKRGLTFYPLKMEKLQLVTFADASFATNRDHSSQLGLVLTLSDSDQYSIVHYTSTKCKRITRSVLAAEVYGFVAALDIAIAMRTTVETFRESTTPLLICTDSNSLFECLTRLGTTMEKRLMIDVFALREAYECRQITEIRWIAGSTNPADALTKKRACKALEDLITTGKYVMQEEIRITREKKEEQYPEH
jgi:Reverse transcriptase (RNA-dependent DNA polymerase)